MNPYITSTQILDPIIIENSALVVETDQRMGSFQVIHIHTKSWDRYTRLTRYLSPSGDVRPDQWMVGIDDQIFDDPSSIRSHLLKGLDL